MATPHKIGLATSCLRISAMLYVVLGVMLFLLYMFVEEAGVGLVFAVAALLFCLALAAGVEIVVYGLRQRKFWAWVAGLCIFGIYIPSLFLPLGALGMWGLLDAGSQAEFRIGNLRSRAEQSDATKSPVGRDLQA